MKEPADCPNCLYTPASKQREPEKGTAPQRMYTPPTTDKTDGDCPQCFYEPAPEVKEGEECPQCFYPGPEEKKDQK